MLAPVMTSRENMNAPSYDQMLLWVTLILLGLGLVMVYSASIATVSYTHLDVYKRQPRGKQVGNPVRAVFHHLPQPKERYASHQGALRCLLYTSYLITLHCARCWQA